MTRLTCVIAAVACLACPAVARAQDWEVSALFGVTPMADLDRRSPDLDQLGVRSGVTFGLQVGHVIDQNLTVALLWVQQRTALKIGIGDASADLFGLTIDQIQANAVYHLRPAAARARPFLLAGLGASFFNAHLQPGETKLAFGLGGGADVFMTRSIGVRGQFRYKPTLLSDEDAGDFCDPFGFCQGTLQQVEFMVGAVVRF